MSFVGVEATETGPCVFALSDKSDGSTGHTHGQAQASSSSQVLTKTQHHCVSISGFLWHQNLDSSHTLGWTLSPAQQLGILLASCYLKRCGKRLPTDPSLFLSVFLIIQEQIRRPRFISFQEWSPNLVYLLEHLDEL